MPRRRASSTSMWAYSRALSEIPLDEQMFIEAAELGDLGTLRSLLENVDETTASRLINSTDGKDRTILEIATENEHLEIVEFVIDHYAPMVSYEPVHECVMLAISKGYVRITQVLLRHPVYQRNRGTLNRLGTITNYYQEVNHSKFDQDVTPLMLAAHYNEVDLIRIFLERGEVIKPPHRPSCECNYCRNRRKFDPLKHSKSAIYTYRALASPAYISLTSSDPILTAFLLSEELSQLARTEKEFKNEYRELVQQCKTYTSELLEMCQNSREVSLILNQEATTLEDDPPGTNPFLMEQSRQGRNSHSESCYQGSKLQRLKLALLYDQKQFVSHPHCQHHLATIWYNSIPGWRQIPLFPMKIIIPLLLYITTPVWAIVYWYAPNSRVGRILSAPLTKFSTHTMAYLLFVVALFLHSVLSEMAVTIPLLPNPCNDDEFKTTLRYHNWDFECEAQNMNITIKEEDPWCNVRHTGIHGLDILIVVYLIGMFWAEVKQLWSEGFRSYFASFWNIIDVFMLNLYVGAFICKAYAHILNKQALRHLINKRVPEFCDSQYDLYYLQAERQHWDKYDPVLINEALFAFANVLSFSRVAYILPISEFLGPLQISLGRMIGDIVRFGVVFGVVFLAFFCSFLNLYWFFEQDHEFGTFVSTLMTLVWSLFGMADSDDPEINDDYKRTGNNFGLTSTVGTILFVIYHIIMSLVMLNMLIAMMSNSFQEIESEQDVEWKFARAKLWMSYFEEGATLPVPFNVIPSPKSFRRVGSWVATPVMKFLYRKSSWHKRRERENIHLAQVRRKRKPTYIVTNNEITRVEQANHQDTMKAIVKRYLFKIQRNKDNDEVNEGELEEIKNDISSLRFELKELLTSGNNHVNGPQTGNPSQAGLAAQTGKPSRTGQPTQDGYSGEVAADSMQKGHSEQTGNSTQKGHMEQSGDSTQTGSSSPGTYYSPKSPRRKLGAAGSPWKTRVMSWPDQNVRMENMEQKVTKLSEELSTMKKEIIAAVTRDRKAVRSVRFSQDSESDFVVE